MALLAGTRATPCCRRTSAAPRESASNTSDCSKFGGSIALEEYQRVADDNARLRSQVAQLKMQLKEIDRQRKEQETAAMELHHTMLDYFGTLGVSQCPARAHLLDASNCGLVPGTGTYQPTKSDSGTSTKFSTEPEHQFLDSTMNACLASLGIQAAKAARDRMRGRTRTPPHGESQNPMTPEGLDQPVEGRSHGQPLMRTLSPLSSIESGLNRAKRPVQSCIYVHDNVLNAIPDTGDGSAVPPLAQEEFSDVTKAGQSCTEARCLFRCNDDVLTLITGPNSMSAYSPLAVTHGSLPAASTPSLEGNKDIPVSIVSIS